MPTLDVNDAFDPSFFDDITVMRYTETIGQNGRVQLSQTAMSAKAVVTRATPDDLARLPEEQYSNKAIRVTTPFRLQGAVRDPVTDTPRTHPDEILWHDSVFVVAAFDDYSGYGRGFTTVVAVSIEAIDGPPVAEPVPAAIGAVH